MSGGRIVDNQAKWRKLGHKGDDNATSDSETRATSTNAVSSIIPTEQTEPDEKPTNSSENNLNAKMINSRINEIKQTSDSDGNRKLSEKSISRHPEPNGIRKDLAKEQRLRVGSVDEKDHRLSG